MMSLFSSFDIFFNYFPLISILMFLILFFNNFFNLSLNVTLMREIKGLNLFFFSLKPKNFTKLSCIFLNSVMWVILLLNFMSVFSFNFPLTSQFGPIIMLGLTVWLSFVMFSVYNNITGFLSHLTPEGSPIYLSFVLFLIELVSNIIRPITLSVRLVANILAGHLLMILLSKLVFLQFIIFPLYMLLNMVELFVALIQSYIFCTMISLYFSEVH